MSEHATVKFRASQSLQRGYDVLDGVTGERLGIVWQATQATQWSWCPTVQSGRADSAKSRRAATLDLLSSLPDEVRERNRVR